MMRRHFISIMVRGAMIAFLVWCGGLSGIHAADVKAPPPAPPTVAAKADSTKPAPIPAAAKTTPEKAPAAATPGAAPAPSQAPASPAAALPGPAPVAPQLPAQGYKITGKSDPFRPFMETDLATKLKKEEELKKRELIKVGRPISPLQQADIAQFRLVGIAGDENRRTAVVEDATGKKYYPLSVGTYIGQNGGRVSAILNDRVIVEERIQNQDEKPAKKARIRRVTVMLHKEKEEGKQ